MCVLRFRWIRSSLICTRKQNQFTKCIYLTTDNVKGNETSVFQEHQEKVRMNYANNMDRFENLYSGNLCEKFCSRERTCACFRRQLPKFQIAAFSLPSQILLLFYLQTGKAGLTLS